MHEFKKIQVDTGVTLAYREYGSGDRYLLSTQNYFFKDSHEALLGQPPYGYHVFEIIMRGYGESDHISDPTPGNYTKVWGEDVAAFARAMGIRKFYYTGVSHGNWAGWYLAFHHPELIRVFVCCDGIAQYVVNKDGVIPGAGKGKDWDHIVGNREELEKMAWIEKWPTKNPARLARRASNYDEHLGILMQRKKEEFLIQNTNMACCDVASEEELLERMTLIPFPVLLWEGALDPASRVEDALAICHRIPGAQLLAYQHLGHGGADECPELAARDCDRFFQNTEGQVL